MIPSLIPAPELALLLNHLALSADLPGASTFQPSGAVDWDRFLSLVSEHQLGPLLASRCPQGAYPQEALIELGAARIRSGHEAFFRRWALRRAFDAFASLGVRAIALKGSAIAETLYGEDAEREMSDVDLLVAGESDLAKARDWLEREGYRPSGPAGHAHAAGGHHEPPLVNPTAELVFELHTNLATPAFSDALMRKLIDRTIELGPGRRALDPIGRLVHHAVHALSDPIESPVLRNLFEVGWMAHRLGAAEREDFVLFVERFELERRVAPALAAASQLFGTPSFFAPRFAIDVRLVWTWRRLGWVESFDAAPEGWRAVERSLATEHFRAMKQGKSVRSIVPFAGAVARVAAQAFEERIRPERAVKERVAQAPVAARAIGDRLLIHDLETKRVHLLDPLSRAVFEECAREIDTSSVVKRLASEGGDPASIERALADLIALDLVRETKLR